MDTNSIQTTEIEREYEYCLVGNIVEKHFYGENKEIRQGTKHFRGGAKVYIFPEFGGCGHENIGVIGLPRKSHKTINVIIPTKLITNVRVKKIYQPNLKKEIAENFYYSLWKKKGDNEINSIKEFAEQMNRYNREHYRDFMLIDKIEQGETK